MRRDRGGVEDPAEHEDAYLLSQEDKEFMAKMKHEQEETLEEERLELVRKALCHCVLVASGQMVWCRCRCASFSRRRPAVQHGAGGSGTAFAR